MFKRGQGLLKLMDEYLESQKREPRYYDLWRKALKESQGNQKIFRKLMNKYREIYLNGGKQ